ncbi:MAG: glycosyltransferase [Rhizobiaceae bacterium]
MNRSDSNKVLGPLREFYEEADEAIRRGPAYRLEAAVRRFEPLAFEEKGPEAAQFWDRLRATAAQVTRLRMESGRPQSLWGVTPIINMRYGAEADRRLGLGSDTLVFGTYYVTSDFDINLGAAQERLSGDSWPRFYAFRRYVMAWALLSYDVFHIYNDRGLLEPAGGYGSDRFGIAIPELEAYRATGKALFTYAYGADHRMRQKTLGLAPLNFCMACPEPGKFCVCDDEGGSRMLRTIGDYATRMVGFGLSVDLLPDPHVMNYLVVDPDELVPGRYKAPGESLKVGHFPNHGYFKGTQFLEDAISELQAEGVAIELIRLSNLPRKDILDSMRRMDLVVDQLISGAFGLTAVEAMALGRPVIAHLRPGVRVSAPLECPIIRATPDTIKDVLRSIAYDRSSLSSVARRGVDYVRDHCSTNSLALSLEGLYREHLEISRPWDEILAARHEHIERDQEALRRSDGSSAWWLRYRVGRGRVAAARWMRDRGVPLSRLVSGRGGFAFPIPASPPLTTKLRRMFRQGLGRFRAKLPSGRVSIVRSQWPGRQILRKVYWWGRGRLRSAGASVSVAVAGAIDRLVDRWLETRVRGARAATERRLKSGKVRTLWGTTPILTLPLKARADRALGFESKSLVFNTYVITRNFDLNLEALRFLARAFPRLLGVFHKIVFGFLIKRYDVFHYFLDKGILLPTERFGINAQELSLLKRAGKRVYAYAYGADVRMRQRTLELGRWNFCVDCPQPGRFCICDDAVGTRTMANTAKQANAVVAMGDMIVYAPGCTRLHYWPIDIERIEAVAARAPDVALRIAHAPNHTHFKGSHYLEAAIETLRAEGHLIEYVKVQGVPNEEVIKLFGEADIVADQFIGGAYGYTALEAMARAKPVLTFVRSPDLVEASEECPLINTNPDSLLTTLRWLLANRDKLPAIGAQGRAYIERWHTIEAVAERLSTMYSDTADFPDSVLTSMSVFRRQAEERRAGVKTAIGWEHPFRVTERLAS